MTDGIDAEIVHEYEHETWTRCAATYLDHFAGLTCETIPMLREAAGVRPGRTVLDVGCGPGHVAGALSAGGAAVTGIDFSARMIEVARLHCPEATFVEANAEQLPFPDASFEAVVSNFVVHHLARPDVVFREVRRVLVPGGRFAFVVFERPEAQSSIGAFFEAVAAHHDLEALPHGPLFGVDRTAYEPPLEASGLHDVRFETREIRWESDSVEPVVQAFMEWGNIDALPEDVRRSIAATARENLEAYREGSTYSFPHVVLLGVASKPG
ncbi:MAG: class I SAM-dependent methyltransferase [Planctomycetota bacterium]|jgi:ubiquinone/menaquinone biosynthesis C-methylase UbiE